MALLELSNQELRQRIESALAANPALELIDGVPCPHCHRILPARGRCPVCSAPMTSASDQPIVFISTRSDFSTYSGIASNHFTKEDCEDNWSTAIEDLPTFLMRQIAPELSPEDRPLAAHILTSLDDDGLLAVTPEEIARFHHVAPSRVNKVLNLIQHAEPIGAGSPNPKAALLVQLEVLAETRPVPRLAAQAICQGMEMLSRHAYAELGRLLHISQSEASQLANFIIQNLNPYPARAHWGDIHQGKQAPHLYQEPDVIISRLNNTPDSALVVEVISPYAGALKVNPLFREAIIQASEEKASHWQADLDEAMLLVKCLQQRNHTLVRMMQLLAVLQRKFLLEGDAHLAPITRAQLAEELGVHESTVSRAVSGKAVQLPNQHIISLSRLFDRSLHIRTALLEIISHEEKPLSDTELVDRLNNQGYSVARRTVAKYRAMEGVLPARLRRAGEIQSFALQAAG
jgi:RNA polymerase sigma-54 factor